MNQKEKKILGVTAASHSLVHLYEGILPPLIPLLLIEFSTDYFHLGVVVSVFSYAFGLGALPAGYLSDKAGANRLVAIFLFGAGILSVFIWSVDSLVAYGVLMGLIGLFCSLYHPAANTLISNAFQQKGSAFAINGIAGSLGIALVPLVSAWMGALMGWKSPYIVFGICGVAVGWFSLTLPKQTMLPIKKTRLENGKDPKKRVSYFNLIVYYFSVCSLGITYRGTMTFLPAYLGQNVHLEFLNLGSVAIGGTFATVALVFGGIGQLMAGHLVDRYKPEKIYFTTTIIGTTWVFLMAVTTNLLLVVSAIFFAFFYFATQPVQNYLVSRYLPAHRRGLGFGIQFFLAFAVGSTAAAASGYIADRFGLVSIFHAMAACFLFSSLLATVLLARTHRKFSGR
ncbi:MAG: MFS transporter [Deltaproteobacteria bacterium]|nr:MFS transporter [Deltaproteobacteria bacterium]